MIAPEFHNEISGRRIPTTVIKIDEGVVPDICAGMAQKQGGAANF